MKKKEKQVPQSAEPQAAAKKKPSVNVPALIALGVMLAATIAIYVCSSYIFGAEGFFAVTAASIKHSVLRWIVAKVPALLRTIQIITIAWLLVWGLRGVLGKMLSRNKRGITIVKLATNFLKYLIALVAFFLILGAWGVNTTTLLASAGILSLIIGLGAQSMISDILAGIFIVFEDEFRVGDIVIIDGWRGTVDEIGIRATKVVDWQGNMRIVNNSEISSIVNQSKELSITTCVVSIAYSESIPKVELVIRDNLDRIRAAIPQIVEGPYYKGVDKLNASSVDLLFVATVKEPDYYVVQRAMNREIKLLFDEHDINIPFPQVTVSYAEDNEETATKRETKRANQFVAEQQEISKTMEDINN